MFEKRYYEEKKQEAQSDIKRFSDKLINDFIRLFNDNHIELNRLSQRLESINIKETESAKETERQEQPEQPNEKPKGKKK